MHSVEAASEKIKQSGVIAILRGDFLVEDMIRIGEALRTGTITVMEVTLNSPSALTALPKLRDHFRDGMLVGAGTVRDVDQARAAREAGAQFIVSPNFNPESVSFARMNGLLHLPGVFTATEAQTAFAAGCRMLKLFPMEALVNGPAYLKALRAPLNDIEFVPTGGVSLENIADYARAGAIAVGLGSKLVLNREQTSNDLTARAKALRQAWEQGKNA
ncbi:MAG TPA: bifunctional 4-hydroxy-2-oxoglutarate aldolase/2-dehydro-3-deoxy-phosphogluconate aldolase [Anaerolineales bacterium]|nr:bifunctional 4-hydroxy-2-oxoglutarate aldolase/2-dehydro-3-deoxy-phosphogluconate aldolase [Anaerolineales bacterium]